MVNDAPDTPYQGRFTGGEHRFALRVYFEDTDFTGVVYHANYLRFIERARSDMLRALGIDQRAAFEAREGSYAVASLKIDYKQPAKLDDVLIIHSYLKELRAASALIHQRVMRDAVLVAEANVLVAFLGRDGRPRRQPASWMDSFRTTMGAD